MRLQDQVCTLEQAKRLRELDLRQAAIYKWIEPRLLFCFVWKEGLDAKREEYQFHGKYAIDDVETAPAFVSEDSRATYWDPEELKRERRSKTYKFADNHWYPAYNVAELGQMLHLSGCYTRVNTVLGGWACGHVNDFPEMIPPGVNTYDTEAQARAANLIHLIETKVLPAEAATA